MKAAGLTRGGFYKQFKSKEDLAVEACARALTSSADIWSGVTQKAATNRLATLIRFYLSKRHRDQTGEGCAFAALGSDAARHSSSLRTTFEDGIEKHLDVLDGLISASPDEVTRDRSISILSTMVGALLLSRAVEDETLSHRILRAAADGLLAGTGDATNDAAHVQ